MPSRIMPYGRSIRNGVTGNTFFYVGIPKTGSSTIKKATRPIYIVEEPNAVKENDTGKHRGLRLRAAPR